jgi:type I restriction enzyme S subunit
MARKMKDSGIEWIGEIPEGWTCKRGKQLFVETNERSKTGSEELLTVSHLTGVTPRSQKNVNMFMSESLVDYKVCHPGDLAANTMWMWQGAIGVSRFHGVISPSYNTYRQRTINYIPEYLDYLLRIRPLVDTYNAYSTGITLSRLRLYPQSFLSIHFIVPPMDEQQKIATYLDVECSRIDAMLAKTRDSIKEYKKLKQAVITQAVTKGVRGEREMKDSGNPWFGQIPADWKLTRVGLHFSIILGKMLCNAPPNDTYTLEPYYCAADVHFDGVADGERKKMWFSPIEKDLYRVSVGDLLVVEGGAGAGGSAIVENQDSDTYIQNSIMIVRSKGNADNRYLRYLLEFLIKQGYIDIVCNKATIPHFTKDKLSCVPFCLCPTGEQKEIAAYLDAKCAEIDKLIAKKEQLVKELESYRKSLIYEVVTGKREV